MIKTTVICDKCKKPIIDGSYYSEVQIISKYKAFNKIPEDAFLLYDLLFGAALTMNNDMKIEVCPECAAKIKEEILLDSK